eukprot:815785-Lingulodinium_polyedra.AAC.1
MVRRCQLSAPGGPRDHCTYVDLCRSAVRALPRPAGQWHCVTLTEPYLHEPQQLGRLALFVDT